MSSYYLGVAAPVSFHPFLLRPSSLLRSTPPPWRAKRRPIAAVSVQGGGGGDGDSFFTVDFDPDDYAAEPESDESPWEGALVYRRDAAVHHLEYASTLERLGLGDLSSHDSRARAAAMGLGTLDQPQTTPVLVSLDVARRRGRLRLDGIVRTVITLGCFRSNTIHTPFSLNSFNFPPPNIHARLLLWSPYHGMYYYYSNSADRSVGQLINF